MSAKGQVALKRWISGAIEESINAQSNDLSSSEYEDHDGRGTSALSSDAFLSPALKVARLLAERASSQPFPASIPGSEWADHIAVRVPSSSDIECEDDRGVVGASSNIDCEDDTGVGSDLLELADQPGDDELDDALKLFSGLEDELLAVFDEDKIEEKSEHPNKMMNYLSVEDVDIPMAPDVRVSNCEGEKSEVQHIYSLGLVLYEIFSGGERPQTSLWEDDNSSPTSSLLCPSPPMDAANGLGLGEQSFALNDESNASIDLGSALEIAGQMQCPNPKKKKSPTGQQHLSVDSLKSKRVPTKLCDLISNMLECKLGDLRSDESYSRMQDVCTDLQLMIERPDKYLRDLDILHASAGLPLDETDCGREKELSDLQDSYKRSISFGEVELGIISGPSGTGKSVLAQRLGNSVASDGAIFLHGKFDSLNQSSPFVALAPAFNTYCEIMTTQKESRHAIEVASRLKQVLGAEVHHLERVMPSLGALLGTCSTKHENDTNQECVNAQKRLLHLGCQFVDIISTYSGAPIVIFLDDLQWSSKLGFTFIKQLLMMPTPSNERKLFILGCCREEGLCEDHMLGSMLSDVRRLGVAVTNVELDCMSKDVMNDFVSNMFCSLPRLTRPLSDILFRLTKGNQLFLTQLLSSLEKDGTLWLSLNSRRYVWDVEKIMSRDLPLNVAAFFAETIRKLNREVQSALTLLSCFGARCPVTAIKTLESLLLLELIVPLEVAVAEGLINRVDDKFCFSHDRVQESAYGMIKPEEQCLYHFKYGVALASYALEHNNEELLFIAVGQINLGGPAATTDAEKRVLVAKMNLKAGKALDCTGRITSAYEYFENGISFLQKGHWVGHYDLSLELFQCAAKCALALGDFPSLNILNEQTLKFAKDEDKLPVQFISTCALAYSNKLPECIEMATSVLAQLGEELPDSCEAESDIKFLTEQTRELLSGYSDEELLGYKMMENKSKLMAMRFYALLETIMQNAKPGSQPLVTLKMVQLSLAYGISPMTPVGLSYFGMLIARLGDVREGYRFVKLANALLNRVGSERAGEVIFVGTQLRFFVEPVQATYEFHLAGYNAAMAAGDISSAMTNMIGFTLGSFEAGISLQLVKENCERARRLMAQQNHMAFLIPLVAVQKSILGIIGEDVDSKYGESLSPYSTLLDHINNMFLDFTFRDYNQMRVNAEKYFECNHVKSWSLLYSHATHENITGLASFWIYRESNDPVWLERGTKARGKFKQWYDAASNPSFESRLHLLEAEEAYAKGDNESAKTSYEKAIASARKHWFIHDEAFSCELAGYFLLEQGDSACFDHFVTAQQKFHEWGALKKADALNEFIVNQKCEYFLTKH